MRTMRWPVAIVMLALGAVPALAQKRATRITGVVVDRTTGQPIVNVAVRIRDHGYPAFTDAEGRFAITDVPEGAIILEATQLGYTDFAAQFGVDELSVPVRIELSPNPVMLEAIQVMSDRLKARRSAISSSVRVFDEKYIAATGTDDAYDFVARRSNVMIVPCGRLMCMRHQGRTTPVSIYIDESPYHSDPSALRDMPTGWIHLVEVIDTQVRVYTKPFAERLAQGKVPLLPVIIR